MDDERKLSHPRISIVDEPVSVVRKHKWVAISTYVLSDELAEASLLGVPVILSEEMLLSRNGPLCYFCGRDYAEVKDVPCPGEIVDAAQT